MPENGRKVYVISDLHLGGAFASESRDHDRGFRIFTHAKELTAFIEHLSDAPTGSATTELVINGDFVDYLSEIDPRTNGWSALKDDPYVAVQVLHSIVSREHSVFAALTQFLRSGHQLTVLLGNHDVELSFPAVRHALEDILEVRDHHRLRFLYDGEAYVIGDVLIEHGNRYDAFNACDHDAIRRMRSIQSRRQVVPQKYGFKGPAGSQLVARVMNPIKVHYPFIDLLKPETEAAVPILLALEPSCRQVLLEVALLYAESRRHEMASELLPRHGGDIAAAPLHPASFGGELAARPSQASQALSSRDALETLLVDCLGQDNARSFRAALSASADEVSEAVSVGGDIASSWRRQRDRFSGLCSLIAGSPQREQRLEALWRALQVVPNVQAFDQHVEPESSSYYRAAAALVRSGFKLVVFGHTHLPRDIAIGEGRYLNTGTWADVLRFPTEVISGSRNQAVALLETFLQCVKDADFAKWLCFKPTYVVLQFDADSKLVSGELAEFSW